MRHGIQVFNGQICICFPLKAFILYVKNRKHLKVGEGEKLSQRDSDGGRKGERHEAKGELSASSLLFNKLCLQSVCCGVTAACNMRD